MKKYIKEFATPSSGQGYFLRKDDVEGKKGNYHSFGLTGCCGFLHTFNYADYSHLALSFLVDKNTHEKRKEYFGKLKEAGVDIVRRRVAKDRTITLLIDLSDIHSSAQLYVEFSWIRYFMRQYTKLIDGIIKQESEDPLKAVLEGHFSGDKLIGSDAIYNCNKPYAFLFQNRKEFIDSFKTLPRGGNVMAHMKADKWFDYETQGTSKTVVIERLRKLCEKVGFEFVDLGDRRKSKMTDFKYFFYNHNDPMILISCPSSSRPCLCEIIAAVGPTGDSFYKASHSVKSHVKSHKNALRGYDFTQNMLDPIEIEVPDSYWIGNKPPFQ